MFAKRRPWEKSRASCSSKRIINIFMWEHKEFPQCTCLVKRAFVECSQCKLLIRICVEERNMFEFNEKFLLLLQITVTLF